MTRIIVSLLVLLVALSCSKSSGIDRQTLPDTTLTPVDSHAQTDIPTLTFIWETDTLLTTVESVLYDPASELIYAANINGHFMEKDGRGSIGTVRLNGEIEEADWVTGLHAPTGLSIADGALYTTDIDQLIEIDITTRAVRNRFPVKGATAFNDVVATPDGIVYASDTGGNAIYKLEDGLVTPFVEDIDTPNGLIYQSNALLVSQWSPEILQRLDLPTKSLTQIASGLPQADGIEKLKDRGYLVSSWGGRIFFVDQEGAATKILDTSATGKNAADVSLIAEENIVLIATFSANTIAAYKIE